FGLIAAFLQHDQNGGIETILAPDLNYNSTLGFGGGFRYLAYPSSDTQWYITATASIDKARRVDLYYATGRAREDWWSWDGRFFWENDPTERFFGIGNATSEGNETNYTIKQLYSQFMVGFNFTENLQLAIIERPRYVRIGRGAFNTDPFIGKLFPNVKGLQGGTEWLTTVLATYDTRDATDLPRSGGLARAYWGIVDRSLGSSVSYTRFGAEVRRYIPIHDRVTIVGHLYIQYTPAGNETPFWSMARLGGYDSRLWDQQTLRGYGAGRFVDNNLDVANIEVRARVYDATVFNTHGIVELAPFLEAGKVWHGMSDNPINRLHPVGGMGFRAIVEPFVVGYVDIGHGGEGTAIFSGINYAF
ncbi:MAG: BamA/TamA family outer membrane protein, partial [Candidatus Binataceae bacterium]